MGRPLSKDAPASLGPATRVVSLVPSETESVIALAGLSRLVGRTDYCVEPPEVASIPSVGGTKRCEVARVIALRPDLVLANQEENGKKDVEALRDAGLRVHLSFPRSLSDSDAYLHTLASLLGVEAPPPEPRGPSVPAWRDGPPRVAVPIWHEPWMSFDEHTFASSILEAAGAENAFAGRARRYPLAADLDPTRSRVESGKDTRYPRFSLEELADRRPDVVLLPDEPFAFDETHARALRARLGHDRVAFVCGKDLFWYGVRAASSVGRIGAILSALDPKR